MPKRSAGILLYRERGGLEFLLVHPGGPLWAKRVEGAWSIPKGEHAPQEDAFAAAVPEFEEETGLRLYGPFLPLGEIVQAGGKIVAAWAASADFDPAHLRSNTFTIEWPPRSGRMAVFPEVDRAAWFSSQEAEEKILPGRRPLIGRLVKMRRAGL
jgi:predicted NUDIX family NTP pyrophosphohydrolase